MHISIVPVTNLCILKTYFVYKALLSKESTTAVSFSILLKECMQCAICLWSTFDFQTGKMVDSEVDGHRQGGLTNKLDFMLTHDWPLRVHAYSTYTLMGVVGFRFCLRGGEGSRLTYAQIYI